MPEFVDTIQSADHDYRFKRVKPTNEYSLMTYILGSRCKNGVVLVADKKIITIDGAAEYQYINKLVSEIENLVIGYSGSRRIFELFRNNLVDNLISYKDKNHEYPTITNIRSQVAEILHILSNKYHRDSIDLLIGVSGEMSLDRRSQLTYFYQDGAMEPVIDYKVIGTGAPYGSIFLKQNWHQDMTMKEVAELGYFIIKYVEKYSLDLSVGVNKDKPQVWFIPDNEANYSADTEVLNEIEGKAEMSLKRIEENKLHKLF